jgi:alcohol dehydrogenase (cytochrome c)
LQAPQCLARRLLVAFSPLVWKINVGTGFTAPPMTFEVGGTQYVAILSWLSRASRNRHNFTPELREMRNQTMLFVFGL